MSLLSEAMIMNILEQGNEVILISPKEGFLKKKRRFIGSDVLGDNLNPLRKSFMSNIDLSKRSVGLMPVPKPG